jgi:hypothetical protein
MPTTLINVDTLKAFGGVRKTNAIKGTCSYGYNFESFPSPDEGYGFRIMAGNTLIKALSSSGYTGYGVFESIQNGTRYCFVYACDNTDGRIFLWDGINLTAKVTGLTKTAINCNGIDFNNRFFFTNGVDNPRTIEISANPQVVVINTTDHLSRVPNGLGLWVYDNRIFMASQYGLCCCANGDESDWAYDGTDTGAYWNDYYSPPTFVYGFSSGIIFGNKDYTDFLTGNGVFSYTISSLSTMGAVGHKAICSHGDKVYFFNGQGVYPVVYTDTNQRRTQDNICLNIVDEFANIDRDKYKDYQLISLADTSENKMWLHIRDKDHENNSVIWVYDFNLQEWYKRIQQTINYLSINDGMIYSVGADLLHENYGTDFNGTYIPAVARLSREDFGSSAQIKKIKKLKMLFTAGTNNLFWLRHIYDGDPTNYQEKLISLTYGDYFAFADEDGNNGGILGDDAGTYGTILDPLVTQIKQIFKPAKRFSLLEIEISCREAGQSFSIERIESQRIKIKI